MVSSVKGMNPVVMNITNPWKKIGQSRHQIENLLVSCPSCYPLKYRGLASVSKEVKLEND